MTTYQPDGPYVIQSGKHAGQVLELLMFRDYPFLSFMLKRLKGHFWKKKNKFHLHLEWLMQGGENRQPKMICPQCKKQTVEYFSIIYGHSGGFSISPLYTCCGQEKCKEQLRAMALGKPQRLMPFRSSTIKRFSTIAGRKEVVGLYKRVFGLPERLTRQVAFEFFNQKT